MGYPFAIVVRKDQVPFDPALYRNKYFQVDQGQDESLAALDRQGTVIQVLREELPDLIASHGGGNFRFNLLGETLLCNVRIVNGALIETYSTFGLRHITEQLFYAYLLSELLAVRNIVCMVIDLAGYSIEDNDWDSFALNESDHIGTLPSIVAVRNRPLNALPMHWRQVSKNEEGDHVLFSADPNSYFLLEPTIREHELHTVSGNTAP